MLLKCLVQSVNKQALSYLDGLLPQERLLKGENALSPTLDLGKWLDYEEVRKWSATLGLFQGFKSQLFFDII